MKKFAALSILVMVMLATGCSQLNPGPGDGQVNWDRINQRVENTTELTAMIAFSRDDVKPHQEAICNAVNEISRIVENYDDPAATFESVRSAALNAVKDLPPEILPPGQAKQIAILVVDQVLDVVFTYVEDSYADLVGKNETRIVLSVTRSVASGLTSACGANFSPLSAEPQGLSKFNVTK